MVIFSYLKYYISEGILQVYLEKLRKKITTNLSYSPPALSVMPQNKT